MDTHCSYVSYEKTGYFSKLVIDYLNNAEALQPFYNFRPQPENVAAAVAQRKGFQHRQVLVQQLEKQYESLSISKKTASNIQSLLNENTFTITTAHQPNIFTGPLYVIYKIFHVIKIAEELNASHNDKHFVPVYYMGSEDADLDELNNITINQIKYTWQTKQTGAVGRMYVDKALLQVLNEIEGQLSVLPYGKELMELFRSAYTEKTTIQQATLYLLNALFADYGLIVLIADDAAFKKIFQPVIEKELKEQFSFKAVSETIQKLREHYKVQASGREINLFYLIDDKRERIEAEAGKFRVASLKLEWSLEEILKELDEHPERFSPNVILRGALQESILPNIIFVGGGGELAYWLELKNVFNAAGIPYPMLVLRNSFLLVDKRTAGKIKAIGFSPADFFENEHVLMNRFVQEHSNNITSLEAELAQAELLYNEISGIASKIDVTLVQHIAALKAKTLKGLSGLEKKMLRAEKRKYVTDQIQLQKIKKQLFPAGSLQERLENFSAFYAGSPPAFFKDIHSASGAFSQQFGILVR